MQSSKNKWKQPISQSHRPTRHHLFAKVLDNLIKAKLMRQKSSSLSETILTNNMS